MSYRLLILGVILCSLLLSAPAAVWANSGEPPSLIIIVNNPPDDLSIVVTSNEGQRQARVKKAAWEGYYAFYSLDMQTDSEYKFTITTDDESFECTVSEPLKYASNVFTLNISNHELTPGKYPFRAVLLVSIRVLLTIIIEGMIFWLFGFTSKRCWIVFIMINLITQGGLNIWLNSGASPIHGYSLIMNLFVGEFFVFLIEMLGFSIFIKEHKFRVILYVITANFISLLYGGYLITALPV